ncbi:MAG: AAA family ATPase [Promethearchaeota archaeon]
MKIQRLSLKNFKCFQKVNIPSNDKDEIPNGLIIIQGNTKERSNSFGKTSLVEAILVAIFGHKGSDLNKDDLITFGENEAEIRLYFELNLNEYLIIRKFKRGGPSTVKYFQKVKDTFKEDPNMDPEKLFQITWDQAKGTLFVKQGEIESLIQARPAELRDMIIKLFRLDITDSAQDYLQKIKSENDLQLKKNQKKFRDPKELQKEIEEEQKEQSSETTKLNDIEKELNELNEQLKDFPNLELITDLDQINKSQMDYESKISVYKKDIDDILNKYKIEESQITSIIKQINLKIEDLEIKIQKMSEEKDELNKSETEINTQINIINKTIDKIEKSIKFKSGTEKAKCPTCQREISTKEKDDILHHFQEEISELHKKMPQIDPKKYEIKPYQNKITEYKLEISELNKINKKINEMNEIKEKIEINKDEIKKKLVEFKVKSLNELLSKYETGDLMDLKSRIISIEEQIKSKNKDISESKTRIDKIKQKIAELKSKFEQMKNLEDKIKDLEKKSLHAEYCKKLIKSFVTEYMVEKRLIKNINSVTSNYIEYFTGRQYDSVSLTSGGAQGTSLLISVHDTYNDIEKERKFLSGGDKAAIGFALRFGISELMRKIRPTKDSPKQNPRVDFLILDEPFGTLDTSRREEILKTLQSQKKFNQIFLITHTTIPEDINAHFIKISKNFSTGLSSSEIIINESII